MKKVIIFVLLSTILVACGGATPTPDVSAIQTQAVQDAIATMTAQAPTEVATPTNTPAPTNTPTPSRPTPTPKPTKTPSPAQPPTPTATAISLATYQDDRPGVVFEYPPGWVQKEFELPGDMIPGYLHLREGDEVPFVLRWWPSFLTDALTPLEEAQLRIDYGFSWIDRSESVVVDGQQGYFTENHPVEPDRCKIQLLVRWEDYSYVFRWESMSHDVTVSLFQLMLPHIRFVPIAATATPHPPTPTALPPTPTTAISWQQVATFQGSDMATTAPFDIQGDAWRVRWTATPRWEGDLPFDIYGFRVGQQPGQDIPIVFVMSSGRGGSDVNYAYTGPGAYCLVVNSAGFNWTIIVEDQY